MNAKTRRLSHRAETALKEISDHLGPISLTIHFLDGEDLSDVADSALERLSDPLLPIYGELAAGVADAVNYEIERRAAWENPFGVWYAIAELVTRERVGSGVQLIEFEKCDGKEAAAAAGKAMILKYADLFSSDRSVEVSTLPGIEWSEEREHIEKIDGVNQ